MARNNSILKCLCVAVFTVVLMAAWTYAVPASFLKKTANSNKAAGSVFPLVMQLVDVNLNPVASATVNLAVTRGAGSINPTTGSTDSNGMISATVTLDSNPGLNTFSITAPTQNAGYVLNVAGF